MIDSFYKEFKVKDYMGNESFNKKKKSIDCSLGTNPFISKRRIQKYIKKAKSISNDYTMNGYTVLKETLLKFYKDILYKNVNEDNISFGSGTMGIIRNLSEFLIQKDTKVLGVAPQFTRFISEVELKKGIYEYYNLEAKNNYQFIANDFINKIDGQYEVIYIDNPNNPTGQIIDLKDIEKIVQFANQYKIITIIDEAYGDYMEMENSSINLVGKYKNIVVIRSASKFFGLPNHRIGYIFADKDFIKIYDKISIPFPFSDLSASAFVNAIKDYKTLEKTKRKIIKTNTKIFQNINSEDYLYTSIRTPIFTLKTNKKIDLQKALFENNVIAEGGNYFINLSKNHARIRINKNYKKIIKIFHDM